MSEQNTKQKVLQSAVTLFYQKGFAGTSVRDIAERANVNVSLISYYFKGKQGLLEYAVMTYYEDYLKQLEEAYKRNDIQEPLHTFKEVIQESMNYQVEHYYLTAFIHRELSLDTTFVREMSVTYIAKEDYMFRTLFEKLVGKRQTKENEYLLLQLKGIMMAPFTVKNNLSETYMNESEKSQFVENYVNIIQEFVMFINKK